MAKIDLSYLESVTDRDNDVMIEMIDLIVDQTPIHIENIRNLHEDKKWTELGAEAHKVKPLFLYVGMAGLKDVAQKIEDSGKQEKELEKIPALIEELETGFDEIKSQLLEQKELLS